MSTIFLAVVVPLWAYGRKLHIPQENARRLVVEGLEVGPSLAPLVELLVFVGDHMLPHQSDRTAPELPLLLDAASCYLLHLSSSSCSSGESLNLRSRLLTRLAAMGL
tara:strand:- start:445 stop:765 length:321 start_codon:yes stop_codon:yes gene_type:complete